MIYKYITPTTGRRLDRYDPGAPHRWGLRAGSWTGILNRQRVVRPGRLFYQHYKSALLAEGYQMSAFDNCLFYRTTATETTYIIVYVDDTSIGTLVTSTTWSNISEQRRTWDTTSSTCPPCSRCDYIIVKSTHLTCFTLTARDNWNLPQSQHRADRRRHLIYSCWSSRNLYTSQGT